MVMAGEQDAITKMSFYFLVGSDYVIFIADCCPVQMTGLYVTRSPKVFSQFTLGDLSPVGNHTMTWFPNWFVKPHFINNT